MHSTINRDSAWIYGSRYRSRLAPERTTRRCGNPTHRVEHPPKGEEHATRFWVFALDVALTLPDAAARKDVDAAMNEHVLGRGVLTAHGP